MGKMTGKMVQLQCMKLGYGYSLQSQHERAVAMARDAFMIASRHGEQLIPIFMPYFEQGLEGIEGPVIGLFPTPWEDPDDKQEWLACVHGLFVNTRPQRYSFWAEVWMARYDGKGPITVEPRNREDRQEFLFIVTVQKDSEPMITNLRIERDWESGSAELINDPVLDGVDKLDGQLLTLLP